jgi:general secretion pathway protein N
LLLVMFLPARLVVPFVQPRLHGVVLGQVHGLLWQGGAEDLRGADGQPLGRLQWQLARSALWGRLDLRLACDGEGLTARGRLQRDVQGRPVWSDVRLQADLSRWSAQWATPLGLPQGVVSATIDHAVLQANWPMELSGRLHWQDAAMQTRSGRVALGTLAMDVTGSHGMLRGRMHDDGSGPLRIQGDAQASPLGWRLDLLLQPRSTDDVLRHWLARLGRPAADGAVRIHRRGGLAVDGDTP